MDRHELIFRIQMAREKANISARELSIKIGKRPSYINELECRKRDIYPSVKSLLRIIDCCNISTTEFFYPNVHEYKKDKLLVKVLQNLSPEIKDKLIDILEELRGNKK